jgi:peptidoglycan/LPS O-acetylase OafA/YrhL
MGEATVVEQEAAPLHLSAITAADFRGKKTARSEILPLTSIRGLAALWVVGFHLAYNLAATGYIAAPTGIALNAMNGGQFAVDIFFVLSGYVLTMTYDSGLPPISFLAHRVARIFPLHVTILGFMAITIPMLQNAGIGAGKSGSFNLSSLPMHFTLTSTWFGLPIGWNAPSWSLSVELAGYFLFPIGLVAVRGRSRRLLMLLLCVLLTGQGLLLTLADFPNTGVLALSRGFLGLGVGMTLRSATLEQKLPFVGLAAITLLGLTLAGQPALAVVPSAYLIGALAAPGREPTIRVMSWAPIVWLGRISFSIYLLHIPMLLFAVELLKHVSALRTDVGLTLFSISFIAAVLGMSDLSLRLVEQPGKRVVQRLLGVGSLGRSRGTRYSPG